MSDEGLLRRLLREHADAVSTETAIIKEDAIVRLFYVVQDEADEAARARFAERDAEVVRLTEALSAANEDAELPDYNPNGTANPKGDAAYWRTRAEAAENVINAAHAVLARQVAEPHTSRGDTNAMVEAITILETVTRKGGEE